jgi:hypothetical protein
MAQETKPVSQDYPLLRRKVPAKAYTPGVKYKASNVDFPIVPVVDPKGKILFAAITANAANSRMVQFTRDGRPSIHPDFEGWALLADLYDREPDKARREAGAKFVDDYIRAWKYHPSGQNMAQDVQWNPPSSEAGTDLVTPVDHLLPQEVLDRRTGKSTPLGAALAIPPAKK